MEKIRVSDLKPGDRYDKAIYIDQVNILVDAGVPVKESDLERLRKWGILEVETAGNKIQPVAEEENNGAEAIKNLTPRMKEFLTEFQKIGKKKEEFKTVYRETREVVQLAYERINGRRPFQPNMLREQVEKLVDLVQETENIFINLNTVEEDGYYLYHQAVNTCIYSLVLGQALDYTRPRLIELGMGAVLADVGMLSVPAAIREKTGKLTAEELIPIRKHPVIGYQLLLDAKIKSSMAIPALQHHETYDGNGYPQGKKENEIEESARIVSIADSFAAQTRQRAYRDKMLHYQAMNNALSADFHRFDPVLLRKFLGRLSVYPIGSLVLMSTDEIGIVIESNNDKPMRPVLKIIRDKDGKPVPRESPRLVDLMNNASQYIIRAIDPESQGIVVENEV